MAAAKKGMEVVLVSEGPLGGTCLNEGCIPTKTLVRWASSGLALADIQVRKQEVVNQLRSGIEFLMKNPLISLVEGRARLVRGEDGKVKVLVGDVLYEGTESSSPLDLRRLHCLCLVRRGASRARRCLNWTRCLNVCA